MVGDDKTACVTTGATSQGNALDMMVLVEDYILDIYYVHVLHCVELILN